MLTSIKEKTLLRMKEVDLDINEDSEIYKLLNILFDDAISKKSNIDLNSYNKIYVLISNNMVFRLINRWNRIGKKYDSNTFKLYIPDSDFIKSVEDDELLNNLLCENLELEEIKDKGLKHI